MGENLGMEDGIGGDKVRRSGKQGFGEGRVLSYTTPLLLCSALKRD
jgi:hypothetical protein